ncbi:MAG: hypothetical protein WBA44_10800 [Mesorhizobium sp.]
MGGAERELSRSGRIYLGVIGFISVMLLGMPLVVVAAYYLFDWQVSVLTFPLLLLTLLARTGPRRPRASSGRWLRFVAGLLYLWAIPIAAVASDNAEIMRLWACAFAVPIAIMLGADNKQSISLVGGRFGFSVRKARIFHALRSLLVAVVFIAASELVWMLGSIGIWIWYHAFAVPIFSGLVTMILVKSDAFLKSAGEKTYNVEPPAIDQSDMKPTWSATSQWPHLKLTISYGNVSLAQAQAILADPEWVCSKLVESIGHRPDELSSPEFAAVSIGAFVKVSTDGDGDGDGAGGLDWRYVEAPHGIRIMGPIHMFKARSVPVELIPEFVAAAWADKWETAETLVSSYIYERKVH